MIRQTLSAIDIIIGLLLIIRPEFSFIRILGLISLGKGLWSLVSCIVVGYFSDWMGILDTLAGIALLLLHGGSSFGLFSILGILMILKGLYSLV